MRRQARHRRRRVQYRHQLPRRPRRRLLLRRRLRRRRPRPPRLRRPPRRLRPLQLRLPSLLLNRRRLQQLRHRQLPRPFLRLRLLLRSRQFQRRDSAARISAQPNPPLQPDPIPTPPRARQRDCREQVVVQVHLLLHSAPSLCWPRLQSRSVECSHAGSIDKLSVKRRSPSGERLFSFPGRQYMALRFALLTVSDRVSRGVLDDAGGDALEELVIGKGWKVVARQVVPDESAQISEQLATWADTNVSDIVFTTGGTGLSPRDVTPEATAAVADRFVPGIPEAIRSQSMATT